jgi:hypothetical protein
MPLIPLCIAIEVMAIRALTVSVAWMSVTLALLAFGTNLLNGGPLLWCHARSTIASYAGELANPLAEPYSPAAKWINENVRNGASVWVLPDYMAYPLMFHAPGPVYAWQLSKPIQPQFLGLPLVHFQGSQPPDYIIAFGPVVQQIEQLLGGWQGVHYDKIATINSFWKDMFRPELFWRTFTPIQINNPGTDAIYVFKRN